MSTSTIQAGFIRTFKRIGYVWYEVEFEEINQGDVFCIAHPLKEKADVNYLALCPPCPLTDTPGNWGIRAEAYAPT